jgi:peptidoglycan/LPS O-acetylase OafA/YrhL
VQIDHGTRVSAALDGVRALAALAVFAGHARSVLFVDYAELAAPGLVERGFYFATGLGHQAVLVFFVLSGLFIGRAVRARHASGTWSFQGHLVDRLSRLWIVVLPALALTLVADALGQRLAPALYDGSHPSNALGAASARLGFDTLFANALFLQTIAAPTFGSNGALWSLANEFWYYVLFPLALRTVVAPTRPERLVCAALALGVAACVGEAILVYFPAWLTGAGLAWCRPARLGPGSARVALLASAAATLVALVAARVWHGLASDYAVALAFAAWVYALGSQPRAAAPAGGNAARVAVLLAASSFTLYAIHLPLVVLVRALLPLPPEVAWRFVPTPLALCGFAGLLLGGLVVAHLVARATEAHTDTLRRRVKRALARTRHPATA